MQGTCDPLPKFKCQTDYVKSRGSQVFYKKVCIFLWPFIVLMVKALLVLKYLVTNGWVLPGLLNYSDTLFAF